jgi:F-type H+-transporting ATPase subunit a
MSGETLLHFLPGLKNIDQTITHAFGGAVIGSDAESSIHVLVASVVVLGILILALGYKMQRAQAEDSVIPESRFTFRSIVEVLCEAVFGMMEGVMGKKDAKFFFPLIGTIAFFILFSNLMGLVPNMIPPTEMISTNVVPAVIVFLATHIYGIQKNGAEHFKHMMGPVLLLAPLIFIIELISHIVRPVSLTLRLFGNMVGDHKVLAVFVGFGYVLVPLPVMFLGLIVCIVQTVVFCILSVVYIGMAIEDLSHDHH